MPCDGSGEQDLGHRGEGHQTPQSRAAFPMKIPEVCMKFLKFS